MKLEEIGVSVTEFEGTKSLNTPGKERGQYNVNPSISGTFVDASEIGEDDFENQEVVIREIKNMLDTPIIIIDVNPVDQLDSVDKETREPLKIKNEKRKNENLKMFCEARNIVDIGSLFPLGGIGNESGGVSMVRINNGHLPHIHFRAINILLKEQNRTERVIPFPVVNEEDLDDFEKSKITYRGIISTPEEYAKWRTLLVDSVQAHGLVDGFATASRLGYEALTKRLQDEYELLCHRVRTKNEEKKKENPDIPDSELTEFPPHPFRDPDSKELADDGAVRRWTTNFIIKSDSGVKGVLASGPLMAEMDNEELSGRFQMYPQ